MGAVLGIGTARLQRAQHTCLGNPYRPNWRAAECGSPGVWVVLGKRWVNRKISWVVASSCEAHLLSVRAWLSEVGFKATSCDPQVFDQSVRQAYEDRGETIFELRSTA